MLRQCSRDPLGYFRLLGVISDCSTILSSLILKCCYYILHKVYSSNLILPELHSVFPDSLISYTICSCISYRISSTAFSVCLVLEVLASGFRCVSWDQSCNWSTYYDVRLPVSTCMYAITQVSVQVNSILCLMPHFQWQCPIACDLHI
jgi:hypothetical protein